MSLKPKIEAVIYASEEPVTLAQLVVLLSEEAQSELDALLLLLWLLRCWLPSHAHLRELLCHSLDTALRSSSRSLSRVARSWWLVSSLRCTICRLSV